MDEDKKNKLPEEIEEIRNKSFKELGKTEEKPLEETEEEKKAKEEEEAFQAELQKQSGAAGKAGADAPKQAASQERTAAVMASGVAKLTTVTGSPATSTVTAPLPG